MSDSPNGEILLLYGSAFVLANFTNVNQYPNSLVEGKNYKVIEGTGNHPLVRTTVELMIYSDNFFSQNQPYFISQENKCLEEEKSRVVKSLGLPNEKENQILYEQFRGTADLFGHCRAANSNGLIEVEWSLATEAFLKSYRMMICSFGSAPFLSAIPANFKLLNLPMAQPCVGFAPLKAEQNGPFGMYQGQLAIYADFKKHVTQAEMIQVLVPEGAQTENREEALIKMGAKREKYIGMPPTGIRLHSYIKGSELN